MQLVGVVALALAAGALLAILFAGIGVVVYYSRGVKEQAEKLVKKMDKFYTENCEELANQREALRGIAESAKSNLTSTRQEVRQALEAHAKAVQSVLDDHRRDMDAIANKINASSLLEASKRGIEACIRLERVASALWKWAQKLDQESEESGEAWGEDRAEEYAPENQVAGTSIYEHRRPEDVLGTEEPADRIPVGL